MTKRLSRYFDLGDPLPFATIFLVMGASLYLLPNLKSPSLPSIAVVLLFAIYALSFFLASREDEQLSLALHYRYLCLVIMFACALTLQWFLPFDFLAILTIILVVSLSFMFSPLIVTIQTILLLMAWFGIESYQSGKTLWLQAMLWGTFHFFAIFMTQTAQKERAATQALRLKNDELKATQSLLTEISKQNERTRIARDLHDLMGHHLTGLAIKLQVAQRLSEGEAKTHIDDCHKIVKLLLSDVREAVSNIRNDNEIHLSEAILTLTNNIPGITVHTNLDADISVDNSSLATTLLRTIQESLTNTLKHARAKNCWISLQKQQNAIKLNIKDDGIAPARLNIGNGLKGMEERAQALNCELDISTDSGSMAIQLVCEDH